jgi:pyruvate dehydrogenase E2 component (dihydrolipoamide acetyltransferase)
VIREFRLPDLGEGLTESELVQWRVAEGEEVTLHQVIAEVETAKAMVELPSPHAGVVERLYVGNGTTVNVGEPIIAFRVEGTDDESDAPQPNLVGYGAAPDASGRPARRARRGAAAVATAPTPMQAPPARTAPAPVPEPPVAPVVAERPREERVRATPPVRRLAEQLGVHLAEVVGTGERGLVTRHDVELAAAASATAPAAPVQRTADASDVERIPVTGVRRRTAEAMVASAFTAPHVTMFLTVDVTATMELLERLRATREFRETRLTFLTAVAKALCLAVADFPEVNARWAGEEIVRSRSVHLGIAAATPRGLVVPVLRDAQASSLAELARRIAELAETARAGRTAPADLSGSTITISNVGVFGVDAGTPLLNPGEAAILAVGQVAKRPWELEGGIALRSVTTLSLSIDHRVLDGEQGSRFLAAIGRTLSDPATVFTR